MNIAKAMDTRQSLKQKEKALKELEGTYKITVAEKGGKAALARLQKITPAGMTAQIDLSITDEYPLAQAQVLIEAAPC